MAKRTVGLDFGSRSIKLLELDTGELTVETFDEEMLPLTGLSYLPDKNGEFLREQRQEQPAAGQQDGEGRDADAEGQEGDNAAGQPGETESAGPAEPPTMGSDRAPWIEALETLLDRHEFDEDTTFVSFLPDGRAISVHEDVPFPDPSKVKSILPSLLEDRLPMDPEEIVYDFKILGEEDEESEDQEYAAVVGIGRKRDLRFFLDRLRDSGVNPRHLGLPELMHRYTLEAITGPREGTAALVDLGHRFTRVLVLDEGDPVLARCFQFGGWDLTRAIAEEFDATYEQAENYKERAAIYGSGEAPDQRAAAVSEIIQRELRSLTRDLRRNFQSLYASDRVRIETLHICGGTSRIGNIEHHLADQFGVEVRRLPLKSTVDYGIVPGEVEPKTALALGLALQPARDRSGKRLLDLRKGEFAYSGRSSFLQGQMVKFGAVAAALFVLFLGTLYAKKYELTAKEEAMKSAVSQRTKDLFGRSITEPDLIKRAVSGKGGKKRAFVPEMSAYQLYYQLMSNVSEDIKLEMDRLDVDIERNIIQMSGITKNPQMVDRLTSDFEKLDCLNEINTKPVKVQGENRAQFRLEINSGCS